MSLQHPGQVLLPKPNSFSIIPDGGSGVGTTTRGGSGGDVWSENGNDGGAPDGGGATELEDSKACKRARVSTCACEFPLSLSSRSGHGKDGETPGGRDANDLLDSKPGAVGALTMIRTCDGPAGFGSCDGTWSGPSAVGRRFL